MGVHLVDTDATITVGIELDDGTIQKVILRSADVSKAIGDTLAKGIGAGVDRSFTGIAVQAEFIAKVASRAFSAVSGAIGSAIGAAVEAEKSLSLFNATLANAGGFSRAASRDFQDFAEGLQAIGVVDDDAIIGAATSLVSIGGLTGDSLKKATAASLDFAAGLQVDVGTAFDIVAKAAAGNTSSLGKYGIRIDENIPKSEKFAEALRQIEVRFQGLNQSQAGTFNGALTQLGNNFSNVLEGLGKFVTGSPALIAVIQVASSAFASLAKSVTGISESDDFLKPLIQGVLSFARAVNGVVLPTFELVLNTGIFVFNALRTGISTLETGINTIASSFASVGNTLGLVSDESLAKFNGSLDDSVEKTNSFANTTAASFSAITGSFTISAAVDKYIEDTQRAVDASTALTQVARNNTDSLAQGISNTLSSTADRARQFGKIVNDSLTNSVSQGVQRIVTNLATGRSAFDGFFKVVLGIIGDLAIQIGTTLVGIGIGIDAIKFSLLGLTGGPAIAAGIALIAVGSLIKALSGGGGASASSPTQTVGTAPGGVAESPSLSAQPELDRNRRTEVAVNISGNVLDRRETGLEIANVLQEFFDTQDGVLARA